MVEENNPVLPQQPVTQPQPVKKPFLSKTIIAIFTIVLILILLPAGAYLFLNSNKQVACTTEAKICPDGSSVGRTGPKCEFQACPASNAADATSTPDPTANWKTYTNTKYNFSIKYPENIMVSNIFGPDDIVFVRISETQKDFREITTLHIIQRGTTGTPKQAFYEECATVNGVCQNKFDTVILNNAVGVKDLPPGGRYFLKSKSGESYILLISLIPAFNDKNFHEFEDMISTFKFTDQTSQIDTSNWKTYNGKTFTLKYPSDWITKKSSYASITTYEIYSTDYKFTDNSPAINVSKGKHLTISTQPNNYFNNYEEYKKFDLEHNHPKNTTSITEFILDKTKCLYYVYSNSTTQCGSFYNGQQYSISFDSQNNQQDLFKQILSTFKFTQ